MLRGDLVAAPGRRFLLLRRQPARPAPVIERRST